MEVLLKELLECIKRLVADMGYDADWVRNLLESMGIDPCIPGRGMRKKPIRCNKKFYKQCNRIERAFAKIKNWRRVDHHYDRHLEMFLFACAFVANG